MWSSLLLIILIFLRVQEAVFLSFSKAKRLLKHGNRSGSLWYCLTHQMWPNVTLFRPITTAMPLTTTQVTDQLSVVVMIYTLHRVRMGTEIVPPTWETVIPPVEFPILGISLREVTIFKFPKWKSLVLFDSPKCQPSPSNKLENQLFLGTFFPTFFLISFPPMDLTQLQNLCKRDPGAYKDEFLLQLQHFQSQLQIFQLKPSKNFKSFQEQVTFLSHVRWNQFSF